MFGYPVFMRTLYHKIYGTLLIKIISLLDNEDRKILSKFADILLKQDKYNRLRKEIEIRRNEVKKGEVLSHEELMYAGMKKLFLF